MDPCIAAGQAVRFRAPGRTGGTIGSMAAPQTPRDVGAVLGERYRLVAPVGQGVSSRVFLAVDTQLRRRVAVKVLHPALSDDQAFLGRFREEARAAAFLDGPNIVRVFDSGEDRDGDAVVPYLVMEYLAGGSLRSILDAGVVLSPSQALWVGLQSARALAHAHRRSVIHRDVKPANLLFDDNGRLCLADFGLARALAEASWTEPAYSSPGTVRYSSPEQVMGQRPDGRSDVYSLALVLIEAVTARVPLLGETAGGTMGRRAQEDVEIPMSFGRLRGPLLRATARDREERSDAGELEIGLLAAGDDMPRPDPLPLVPTMGADEHTRELHLSDPMAGVAILGGIDPDASTDLGTEQDAPPPLVAGAEEPAWSAPAPPPRGGRRDPVRVFVGQELDPGTGGRGRVDPLSRDDVLRPLVGSGPGPRTRRTRAVLAVLAVVAVVVGGAAGWWFLVRTPTHEVPDWTGQPVGVVSEQADDLGWSLSEQVLVRRDGTQEGEVVAQEPAPGSSLPEGEAVALTVSLGPTLVTMPDVVGLSEAEATAALESAGLVVASRADAHDETVAAGAVVSATAVAGRDGPDAQGQIARETPLDVVVSDGPAPRAVPDGLVGATRVDAEAKLVAVQLVAAVEEAYSETVAKDVVISAGTAPGTEVARGSAVALVVSAGPAPVPVPDVRGQSGSAAAATLEAAGFPVAGIEGSPSGVVLATDPPSGEPHLRGTPVRIFTRR
jgi:serine/threonine-protein kinase